MRRAARVYGRNLALIIGNSDLPFMLLLYCFFEIIGSISTQLINLLRFINWFSNFIHRIMGDCICCFLYDVFFL